MDLKHTKYNLAYYLAFMPDAPEYPPEILAINRGEREGVLEVKVDVDTDEAAEILNLGQSYV